MRRKHLFLILFRLSGPLISVVQKLLRYLVKKEGGEVPEY